MIWQRYSAQVNSNLESDINILKVNNKPWNKLLNNIKEQRGRINIEPSDFIEKNRRSSIFRPFYNLIKKNKAVDWFNGLEIGKQTDSPFKVPYSSHLPKNILKKNFKDEKINDLCNFAFITAPTNLKISDSPPKEYLPSILNKYPDALKDQFIPENKDLWEIDSYEIFLKERAVILAKELNDYFYSLTSKEDEPNAHLFDLLSLPENERLEYKETWIYNVFLSEKEKKTYKRSKNATCMYKDYRSFYEF